MDVSPETKLNKQSTCSYKSFADSFQSADGSSPSEPSGSSPITCDLDKNHDHSHLPKEIPLKEMASGSPNLLRHSLSNFKETDKDCSRQDSLMPLCVVSIIFAIGVTVALILHFYLWESLVFVKGVLVSDHERCSALGQKVLHDHGSSVDAAIAATLCLGVLHPHVSVFRFQSFKHVLPQNYCSLSWEDVVTRAAAVAKEGFNVSLSLAEAISKVKGEQLPQRFRGVFFPGGQALRPGSFLRMPLLAGVLEAGLSNFYDGNFSQEIVDEVRTHGGVLSKEDLCNYTVEVEQPVEGLYNEFIIQVPPPPSTGAALISAFNLLEGLRLNKNNNTENQTYHWIAEALKGALALASGLGDPKYNSSVTELLSDILSKNNAEVLRQRLSYSGKTPPKHYSAIQSLQPEPQAGQVIVMGSDDLMVSVASSLSRPFGSRLITRSGVVLNSLIFDFSWPNKTRGQFQTNQRNGVQAGKRPLSSLMPTIVVPAWHKCGIYMALGSSGGHKSFSAITQVLMNALSNPKEKNDTLSLRRNRLLDDSEFPEESVQSVRQKGHVVQRVKTNSVVQGILRNKDTIKAIALPQLSDGLS
ncbi:glutathione hydrolase 7-like isoform X3 [Xiphias gladius]|uniref:glutathione hydrolase 7-like isoform X3 n=1 Tax=Xiphias gladius TaxID=8245 RepID=UPI001A99BE15|nr:glutathione hydrolase 7-like isoform X3 [Xiphias gladius]